MPCLFVRRDARGEGLSQMLLQGAVSLARSRGAAAIEGFPFAGAQRRSGDIQVGAEQLFASCGFVPSRRPSESRVVMRLDLS